MELESTKRKRLDEAYVAYADDVYRVMLRFLKEDRFINDIVQDTFIRFYEEMDEVNDEMLFPWLIRVAKNLATSMYRHEKVVLEQDSNYLKALEHEVVISAEDEYIEADTRDRIRRLRYTIFDRLNEEHPLWFEVLMLVYIMDIPQKDVAERLGVSMRVVHSRLHRARCWIKKHYNKDFEEQFKRY